MDYKIISPPGWPMTKFIFCIRKPKKSYSCKNKIGGPQWHHVIKNMSKLNQFHFSGFWWVPDKNLGQTNSWTPSSLYASRFWSRRYIKGKPSYTGILVWFKVSACSWYKKVVMLLLIFHTDYNFKASVKPWIYIPNKTFYLKSKMLYKL